MIGLLSDITRFRLSRTIMHAGRWMGERITPELVGKAPPARNVPAVPYAIRAGLFLALKTVSFILEAIVIGIDAAAAWIMPEVVEKKGANLPLIDREPKP